MKYDSIRMKQIKKKVKDNNSHLLTTLMLFAMQIQSGRLNLDIHWIVIIYRTLKVMINGMKCSQLCMTGRVLMLLLSLSLCT